MGVSNFMNWQIGRRRLPQWSNVEQRKLILSLIANLGTRIPGLAGLLFLIPLFRYGLGVVEYESLLASIALGTVGGFLLNGFSLIGRRAIGEAYARRDQVAEAQIFRNLASISLIALLLSIVVIILYSRFFDVSINPYIASMTMFLLFTNMFDNVRAAYNEHYVTAFFLLSFQIIMYALAIFVAIFQKNLILAALVLQGPGICASIIALILLIVKRPYLLRRGPIAIGSMIRSGMLLSLADGMLLFMLNVLVVVIAAAAAPTTSAWFATLVRLFSSLLIPAVLLLTPLASYIRIIWVGKTARQKVFIINCAFASSVIYSALITAGLPLLSYFYIQKLLNLPEISSHLGVISIYTLMAAIVIYRVFSSIAYMVLNSQRISYGIILSLLGAIAISGLAAFMLAWLSVIYVFCFALGIGVIISLLWNLIVFQNEAIDELNIG